MENNTNIIGGSRRENRQMRDLSAGDPWAESDFFAPTATGETGSEHLKPWPKDATLAGIFRGMRVANRNKPANDQRDYAVFETDDGTRFRCYTPGQLKFQLGQAGEGNYVEMTYLGKEYVEAHSKDLHQFRVVVDEGPMN